MEDEKLIECVRNYQFLYDLNHPKSMDGRKKDITWKEIGNQIKQPPAACKQRWQNLRDAYRRMNIRKSKSGQAATKMKKWKYEDEMSFLAPFMAYRKKDTEAPSENEDDEDNDDTPLGSWSNEQNSNTYSEVAITEPEFNTTMTQDPTALLVAHLIEERKSREEKHDELDKFFLSISKTCKKFSPYMQAVVKKKIFSIVSEVEIQQLASSSTSQASQKAGSCIESPRDIKEEFVEATPYPVNCVPIKEECFK